MRGKTDSGQTELLNFGKYKQGYGYVLTEFEIYPSTAIGTTSSELTASITAGKTAQSPPEVDFSDDGLIACCYSATDASLNPGQPYSIINDTYIITQNLILMVRDTSGNNHPVNWQCRFKSVKMTGPEEAAVNYKQFAISDE